jgi:hypothetical protein
MSRSSFIVGGTQPDSIAAVYVEHYKALVPVVEMRINGQYGSSAVLNQDRIAGVGFPGNTKIERDNVLLARDHETSLSSLRAPPPNTGYVLQYTGG